MKVNTFRHKMHVLRLIEKCVEYDPMDFKTDLYKKYFLLVYDYVKQGKHIRIQYFKTNNTILLYIEDLRNIIAKKKVKE